MDVVTGSAAGAQVLADLQPGAPRSGVEVRADHGSTTTVGARRLLLATGLVDVLPDVEGLAGRWGVDVLRCPFCHGREVRGQAIGVIGTGPVALHQVLLFRQLSDDVVHFQHSAPDPSQDSVFPTPEQTLDGIGLDLAGWEVAVVCEDRDRQADGPGGRRATVTDTVIALVRL